MSVFFLAIVEVAISNSSSDEMTIQAQTVAFFGLAPRQVYRKIFVYAMWFACTIRSSRADSVSFLHTGLKQRPQRQESPNIIRPDLRAKSNIAQ
jgi:hypothetical protein